MSTAKQVQANQQNAQKSTGPRTPEGKAKVSQNAVTHGLTSKRPVLDIEDTAEFRGFVNELLDQLDPTNPLEFFFAKRASCQAWRIQRAQCYETLVLDKLVKSASQKQNTNPAAAVGADPCVCPDNSHTRPPKTKITDYIEVDPSLLGENEDPKSVLGQALMDDFRYHWTLDKLARYETRLENSMIRCLNKFQKVRESKMMNFTGLRQYYRDFQPRPQDFMDNPAPKTPAIQSDSGCHSREGGNPDSSPQASPLHNKSASTPQESSSPNVAKSPLAVMNEIDKTKLTMSAPNGHPESPKAGEGPVENSPSSIKNHDQVRSCQLHNDHSLDAGMIDQPSAQPSQEMPIDSFKNWRQLYCQPRGKYHNYDDSNEVPEVPHRPDVPQKGEYVYRKNWQHRFLDLVNYPWEKRRKLTEPELTELVDPILSGFPDPVQFLWDFGLIELTSEAVTKRYPKPKAG